MPSENRPSLPRLPDKLEKILFVCTGNSCRSVMAEGIFNHEAEERGLAVTSRSAGVSALDGLGPTEETIDALKKDGIDMSHHQCRRLTREMIHQTDLILAMDVMHQEFILQAVPEMRGKVLLLTVFYKGKDEALFVHGVPDPIGMNREFYGNVMTMIRRSIENLVQELEKRQKGGPA